MQAVALALRLQWLWGRTSELAGSARQRLEKNVT